MTQQTKIEWTDFTVNFWEGCQKVGPGCDHCYAEARDTRFTGGKHWGPGAPRRKVKGGIAKLRKINRDADKFHAEHGHWPRVFCSSLSDIFDNVVDPAWRAEAFKELTAATNTRPQLLTKRVGNVFQMIPPAWAMKWPAHIGLMITVVNQAEADRDIPKLLDLRARLGIPWVGLSMEPLLGPVSLKYISLGKGDFPSQRVVGDTLEPLDGRKVVGTSSGYDFQPYPKIDWVIVGGESGHQARPTHPDWIRSLRDQCEAAGTPFLFKQWGEWVSVSEVEGPGRPNKFEDGSTVRRTGKKRAGRLLDGREWNGVPT
ncbi:phage Gp37/Gp68 family protein [Sulfitobacter pontiacus]|uniref:phage Gp37/Gp68 family protein n=1 Tax=Sulfitobacter pontiacus TaxID=60137 RepID=UPI002769C715|nr:phage Gp37/Gp68 family protein [Sulfitobacter pontiacus]GLO78524.1 hypothetical protein MACH23_19450 [Sulfitobacter pontiacus]